MSSTPAVTTGSGYVGGGSPQYVGTTASSLVGFHGADPVDQYATITSVSTTAPVSGAFGFETSAQAIALLTAVNSLIAMCKEKGLIAS